MDFGDLKSDKSIQTKITNLHNSIEKLSAIVEVSLNPEIYEKISTKEKVDFDLFVAYTLNTLYWVYLKTKGEDPNNNDIKNQLNRIKQQMLKAKEAHERETLRPRLDKPAAGRFIKHGINNNKKNSGRRIDEQPPNKRIKFSDDD